MPDPCATLRDPARIAALRQSRLLEALAEPAFDRLTRLASYALSAPAAILSLMDGERAYIKSSVGIPEPLVVQREVPLSRSFCQLVVTAGEPIRIADVRARAFLQDDWAIRQLGIVAYAGVPVATSTGHVLGALCVIDRNVRVWTDEEIALLVDLGAAAQTELQLRQHVDELQRLEAQLLQMQKTESLGRLASGIAHDFNNLLTAIIGYTELALRDLSPGDAVQSDLREIAKVARRATDLTSQLLGFARNHSVELCALNVNDLILDMDKLLRRLLTEDIELITLPDPNLQLINADPGRLGQVLVNLVINARDALLGGGQLIIKTANIQLNQSRVCNQAIIDAGCYVLVSVIDTGMGMAPGVLARAFEPFFTTKEPNRGTGLGLATCASIVKQHGGFMCVESEPGHGTSVSIYLPRTDHRLVAPPCGEADVAPLGTETILLAEDETSVRASVARGLRALGYTVLEAADGKDALSIAQRHQGVIDLLVADLVMPGMSGQTLAEHVKALYPSIAILFMSGYTSLRNVQLAQGSGASVLQKPFLPAELARSVRQQLDTSRERDRGSEQGRSERPIRTGH
jgi:signal transduction histidine kinase/CheY-like chemotaxis protein